MYKIKQNFIYKLEYDIKLNTGLIFKLKNEIKVIKDKIIHIQSLLNNEDEDNIVKLTKYQSNLTLKQNELQKCITLKGEAEEELRETKNGNNDEMLTDKFLMKKKQKEDNKIRRDEKKKEWIDTHKTISKKYYQNSYQARRKEKYKEKDYKYHYNLFMKKSNSAPNYILKNLRNMPNNRGYIWKGVWFWGRLPQKENDNTMCMYEICGKKTYIRQRNNNGQWTIRLKKR